MTFNYELKIIASDDPYPIYKWMRENDPAHYSEIEDVWVLSRYEDVVNAFKDWKTWSSQRRGNLLNDIPSRIGKTLGTTDPPKHTFARRLVNKAFTPRTIAGLEPKIKSLAQELARDARERGTIEFVADVSAPYNAAILGAMFGLPEEDFIQLRHWLDDFFLRETPKPGEEPVQEVAMRHLRQYLNDLAEKRLASHEDDLMTAMLLAEEDGQRLEHEQVVVTTMTFLVAGFESTNNLFTNLTYALALHPHVYGEVKANAELVPNFVEEGMRWDAAAQGFVRSPNHDVELHGNVIPENAQVLLHIGSANRDENAFPDADTFDIHRTTNNHLGMGSGIHFCIGSPLGRLMSNTIFEEFLAVSDQWEIDLENAVRVTTPNFRGFSKLPLTLT
ncbi:MAG TPA: cytochrome P450 [Aggregatilineales bacterium]|nr:cytochrome P450 [Aggregatilineales bacterium]